MSDQAFEYRGYWVKIEVREAGNESASGVFTSLITVWPDLPEGKSGNHTVVEKGGAQIYLSEDAADAAAAKRARNAIDRLAE